MLRLQRRRVLELVDQRHRVLRQDALAQALGAGAVVRRVQGLVQPPQHVGEAEGAGLLLELGQALLRRSAAACRRSAWRSGGSAASACISCAEGVEVRRQSRRRRRACSAACRPAGVRRVAPVVQVRRARPAGRRPRRPGRRASAV